MPRRPKKIFLSSTCFDLIDLRAELKSALSDSGYIVYASETPDFPVDPKLSTHDNCLKVVKECDIYLLIIHTKYGSPYRGNTRIKHPDELVGASLSVTFAEYLTALAAGLEVRIWVRDFIWASSPQLTSKPAGVKTSLPRDVDPSVFTFIDYIKNHPHEAGSWINQFHSVVDLKASIIHWLGEVAYADSDEFRLAVSEISDLLGYSFDRSLLLSSAHSRVLAHLRDSPFEEVDAIWPIYRKSASPATWRHLRDVIQDAADEITQGICDRALLIISSSFDASVSVALQNHPMHRRIRLITFDDLVSTLIPFSDYLMRIVYDFEHFNEFATSNASKDPIIDIMRRCDLVRYYVPLRGRCSPSDMYEYVREWLSTPNANQLTLLGDFGTGKSSFALWLTYKLAKEIVSNANRDARIPLFVSLRDHVGKVDVREIIVNTLANTYGIRNVNFNSFLKLLDTGRILIIFDGFDETATRADTGQSLRILRELNSLVRRKSKIILSCRTHYFRTETEAQTQLTSGLRSRETELFTEHKGRTNFEILYLKEFDPSQIEEFLKKHFNGDLKQTKRTLTNMHSTYNLWDLARRPVLLEMILKVFPRLSRKLGRTTITPAELYKEYIEEWLAHVAKGNEESLDAEGKRKFCDNLAQWMYKSDRELLPYSELESMIQQYFKGRPLATYAALDTEVRTCSFLNRDSGGNYQFVHRSFMEFFVANALSKELSQAEFGLMSAKPISFEISNFLRGLLPDEAMYLRAIEHTRRKSRDRAGWTGRNAITMLTLIGCDFRHRDFSHCILNDSNFMGADLSDCNFQETSFIGATFANATLTNADFSGADLTEVDIREFRCISCVAWGPDRLVVGSEDGSVRVYSSVTWELEAVRREHNTPVYSIVVSPGEQFFFTISDERLVAWSIDEISKFAEFTNQNADIGPIKVKLFSTGYEISILSEPSTVFVRSPVFSKSVDELEISVRTYNCLKNLGTRTIGELINKSETEVLQSKNFGKKSLNELGDILRSMGLDFGMQIPPQTISEGNAEEPYGITIAEHQVAVYDNLTQQQIFTSPQINERPLVATYSDRQARLAVGTAAGRTMVWDVQTGLEVANLEQTKLACKGLRLSGAKGLDQLAPNSANLSLGEWLAKRGAMLPKNQRYALERERLQKFAEDQF
jgi:uncharacterized protein YjbI with pentapeptide repeats